MTDQEFIDFKSTSIMDLQKSLMCWFDQVE